MGCSSSAPIQQEEISEKYQLDISTTDESKANIEQEIEQVTDKQSITPKSRVRRGNTNQPKKGKELRRRRLSLVTHGNADVGHSDSAAKAVAEVAATHRRESFSDQELRSPHSPETGTSLTYKGAIGFEGQQVAEGLRCRHLPYNFGTYSRRKLLYLIRFDYPDNPNYKQHVSASFSLFQLVSASFLFLFDIVLHSFVYFLLLTLFFFSSFFLLKPVMIR